MNVPTTPRAALPLSRGNASPPARRGRSRTHLSLRHLSLTGHLIRVLHLPLNTPYARKLHKAGAIEIANGAILGDGESIPSEITFQWILRHANDGQLWSSFDILHIHFGFEFESMTTVQEALALVIHRRKGVVYTCHDTVSVHGTDAQQYAAYLELLGRHAHVVITLTNEARAYLSTRYSDAYLNTVVIPHGFALDPENPAFGYAGTNRLAPRLALFGAVRYNRQLFATLLNLYYTTAHHKATFALITKPITEDVQHKSPGALPFFVFAQDNPRISIVMRPWYDDDDLVSLIRPCDALLLPYVVATHSGQLALSLDLGVTPVMPCVGHLVAQYSEAVHSLPARMRPPAVIVDADDTAPWRFQSRFAEGVERLCKDVRQFRERWQLCSDEWRKYRRREHNEVIARHFESYQEALLRKR